MDALTFIAEMTKALAWPAGAVAITALARRPVRWAEAAQRVLTEGPALPPGAPPVLQQPGPAALAVIGSAEDPLAMVIRTWVSIEARIGEAAKEANIATEKKPLSRLLDELVKAGRISAATAEGFRGLQQLRNLAVHSPNDAALAARLPEFRAMAGAMLWTLEDELKAGPSDAR